MTGPIRKIMGVTGDHVWAESETQGPPHEQELTLFVNGGGSVLALTPDQLAQRLALQGQTEPEPETKK